MKLYYTTLCCYLQAAELFGAVDDDRAAGVVSSMHAFLQQERVIAILEGKDVPPLVRTI
jgi:hypothetical protein